MDLLPINLRLALPRLGTSRDRTDPIVYVRFFLPGTDRAWYAIEGSPEDRDFRFFGWSTEGEGAWCEFRLSDLTRTRGLHGERMERDLQFEPGAFHDVVPPPEF